MAQEFNQVGADKSIEVTFGCSYFGFLGYMITPKGKTFDSDPGEVRMVIHCLRIQ